MDGPIPGAPVGAGGEAAVPLPPDHTKARAFREASCPREMREIVIKNFGEHPNPADPARASLTAQCDQLMRALQPIIAVEYDVLDHIEKDIDARDLRYRVRVSNPYNARRLVKRLNGFELGKEEEPWAVQLRHVYTDGKWDALIDSLGNQKLKAAIVRKPKLTASEMGDRRFARFGISVYLYFYALRRLARLMCIMAALALPAALLNLWDNRATKPGCFDDDFPLAPLACVAFVSAGNVPTIGRYNDSLPLGEFVSHYDRHLLFSLLDVAYTCVFLFGLRQIRIAERRELATNDDDLTSASDYTVQVSRLPEGLKDPQLIRDFFEYRFGPVVEVSVAMRSTRLLKAYAQLGKKSASLHIAQARGRNKLKESKRLINLKVAVEDLRNEIGELTTSADEEQTIVCAFVTFDRYEDCQKALSLYSGFVTGFLCLDHRFRWKGTPQLPGTKTEEDELEEEEDGMKGGLLARCQSGGGLIDWGKRLRVERAPEPANILWENFGVPAWTVVLRRIISALASFVLIICTVTAFVIAEQYRGSSPSTCNIAVCDDRLEFPLLNQNVSFPRAVIGESTELGVEGIGLACAYQLSAQSESGGDDEQANYAGAQTELVFREGITNSKGHPTCLGGYEFCQGLEDEVRRDLEYSVCKDAYFRARLFSNAMFEYVPWVALVLVNVFLRWGVKRLGLIERHTSKAERALSVAKKLFLAQFINTALAIWLAHVPSGEVMSKVPGAAVADATSGWGVTAAGGGLSAPAPMSSEATDGLLGAQWYRETGSGLTVALLINMLLPRIGVYARAAWGCMCRTRCCSCCAVTQEQLNQRYAGQFMDLSERYACLWTTIFSTMFYSSGMPVLLSIGAMDLSLMYYCERNALFKHYAKPEAYDEQLAVLSSSFLNYAALLHLIGAVFMYSDSSVWARWTITSSEYAKTRARGINATVEEELDSTGALDGINDALELRHVLPIVLMLLAVVACALFKSLGPRDPLRPCRRWKFCRFRVVPERAYRTYTESVGEIRLGGLESYEIRNNPDLSSAFDQRHDEGP